MNEAEILEVAKKNDETNFIRHRQNKHEIYKFGCLRRGMEKSEV